MVITATVLLCLLFFVDLKISYENSNYKYKMEYNGLVWVILDRISIWNYDSKDVPKQLWTYSKTKV